MRTRAARRVAARYAWDRLRVSFWFAPAVTALGAIMLMLAMTWLDNRIPNTQLENSGLVLSGSPDSMRTILIGMAGIILTTAGVVFTLLTLPLSTVAAQYGSRLLRLFLADRTTQFVLGMFVGAFVYCVAAALSIPPAETQPESAQLTATVGLFLMLVTFSSLILLVQHISTMLQAPNIAVVAGDQLREVVLAETPDAAGSADAQLQTGEAGSDILVETAGYPVCVQQTGYIQYVDLEYMLTLAGEQNLVVRLMRKPGAFVSRGTVVALVWPAGRAGEQLDSRIHQAFQIGNKRTPTQDIEYAVNQLVEMAVRAMSPAINDPFTAMTCLDHMGNGLALFAHHGENPPNVYDRDGRLRIVFEPVTFGALLSAAFDMLRHCSCDNASVLLHMLAVIDVIGQSVTSPEARQQLLRHVCLIQAESQAGDLIEQDRQSIHQRGEALQTKLNEAGKH